MKTLSELWDIAWNKELANRVKYSDVPQSEWKASGRATKKYPNKEDDKWWAENGPQQLESWVQFRKNDWQIYSINGQPAIELNLMVNMDGVPVKMAIDRLMVTPEGELIVLDIKSGRTTPEWLQLAFYAAGLDLVFGLRPKWGTYWMARTGVTTEMVDLDKYPTEVIVDFVKKFDTARKEGIFLPNLSHCSRCGFNNQCKWKE